MGKGKSHTCPQFLASEKVRKHTSNIDCSDHFIDREQNVIAIKKLTVIYLRGLR